MIIKNINAHYLDSRPISVSQKEQKRFNTCSRARDERIECFAKKVIKRWSDEDDRVGTHANERQNRWNNISPSCRLSVRDRRVTDHKKKKKGWEKFE